MSSIARKIKDAPQPAADERAAARELADRLERVVAGEETLSLRFGTGDAVGLPETATRLFYQVLREMEHGRAVSVQGVDREFTTQEAADYLHVSRPYFIKLLEQGKMKFHTVGAHRRIRFSDLEAYRIIRDREREEAMQALVDQALELGLY